MQNSDEFSRYHPLVNFVYFVLVLSFSMVLMHPVCLLISLVGSFCYDIRLNGKNSMRQFLKYAFLMLLMTVIINPVFNHQGSVVLCYLPKGNPLTLESIIYGFAAAAMLICVLLWFRCLTVVMTSDKLIWLFGRIIPSLSLVLSMSLRFVPKFKQQFAYVRQVQALMGRNDEDGGLFRRIKSAVTCFSITVTWSLENSIETADSMKSRGYGLKGRTAFSIYEITERDKAALLWFAFCAVYLLSGALSGGLFWRYFPSIGGVLAEPMTISFEIIYFALCITPLIIDKKEDMTWKSLK